MLRQPHLLKAVTTPLILVITSCGPRDPGEERLKETSSSSYHAVHLKRVRAIMQVIGSDVSLMWPQEIAELKAQQARENEQQRFTDAARIAGALAEAAQAFPEASEDIPLPAPEREEFFGLARNLQAQAVELRSRAFAQDLSGMKRSLWRIRETCVQCHQQFREVSGPLAFAW